MTKEAVATKLCQFTDSELAELGLTRKAAENHRQKELDTNHLKKGDSEMKITRKLNNTVVEAEGASMVEVFERLSELEEIFRQGRCGLYDDPHLLFNAVIPFTTQEQQTLLFLRRNFGFFTNGDFVTNQFGKDEKWFQDRNGHWHNIIPNGSIHRYVQGMELGTFVDQVSPLVYDDPSKLFKAVELTSTEQQELASLRILHGFHFTGNFWFNSHTERKNGSKIVPENGTASLPMASFGFRTAEMC